MGPHDSADQFRERVIELTVRSARRRSSYYRDKWGGVAIGRGFCLADLASLPITTKAAIQGNEAEWASARDVIAIQNTSGSTGLPLFVYRTEREFRFIERFFPAVEGENRGRYPLSLHLSIPQHGCPTPIPGQMFTLQAAAYNDKLIEYSVSLLKKRFSVPHLQERVSLIGGDHNSILLLTRFLQETKDHAASESIRALGLTGRLLTDRWRKVIERTWSAKVYDRYSLSEIFGGASHCGDCGGYHFDPHVVAEIVPNLNEPDRPVHEGSGSLLLTTLAPFVTNQPFIRYLTGDLFRAVKGDCRDRSFFYLGRRSHTLFRGQITGKTDDETVLIEAEKLINVVDSIPGVRRPGAFRDVTRVADRSDINLPFLRGGVERRASSTCIALDLAIDDLATGPYNAPLAAQTPKLRPLAEFLGRSIKQGGVSCDFVIRIRPESEFKNLEKKSDLWIDSPQK